MENHTSKSQAKVFPLKPNDTVRQTETHSINLPNTSDIAGIVNDQLASVTCTNAIFQVSK